MKQRVCLSAALFALLFLPSCAKTNTAKPVFAFDTVFEQTVIGGEPILDLFSSDEAVFSRTLPASELYRLNEAGGGEASGELLTLLTEAKNIAAASDGAFDFTLAPVSDLWNFTEAKLPEETALADALTRTGYERVSINGTVDLGGTAVDLGGIAKGYEVGKLLALYREQNVKGALVSCSSSVGVIGTKANGDAFQIGVRDPDGGLLGVLSLTDSILSTSGDYERCFTLDGVRYHHILDPDTGTPVQNGLRSVTVVAPLSDDLSLTGARTDALSTALFVLGRGEKADALLREYGMEAIFVTDDGIFLTAGLKENFSTDRAFTVLGKDGLS